MLSLLRRRFSFFAFTREAERKVEECERRGTGEETKEEEGVKDWKGEGGLEARKRGLEARDE